MSGACDNGEESCSQHGEHGARRDTALLATRERDRAVATFPMWAASSHAFILARTDRRDMVNDVQILGYS